MLTISRPTYPADARGGGRTNPTGNSAASMSTESKRSADDVTWGLLSLSRKLTWSKAAGPSQHADRNSLRLLYAKIRHDEGGSSLLCVRNSATEGKMLSSGLHLTTEVLAWLHSVSGHVLQASWENPPVRKNNPCRATRRRTAPHLPGCLIRPAGTRTSLTTAGATPS